MATIQKMNGDLKVTLKTFLFGIVVAGGITASHFTGLSTSKDYTDRAVADVDQKVDVNLILVKDDLTDIMVKMAKIEQILVERYGQPKGGRYDTKDRKHRHSP